MQTTEHGIYRTHRQTTAGTHAHQRLADLARPLLAAIVAAQLEGIPRPVLVWRDRRLPRRRDVPSARRVWMGLDTLRAALSLTVLHTTRKEKIYRARRHSTGKYQL